MSDASETKDSAYDLWLRTFRGDISITTFEAKVDEEEKVSDTGRLEVRVLGHEVQEKSYGGLKNVVMYQLSWQRWKNENDTNPETGAVQRRYSDFDWLREILTTRYRGMLVPPLPSKKLIVSENFLNERQEGLQFFLNEVSANAFLSNDHTVALFLKHGAEVALGGTPNSAAKAEWSDIKSGILTDERKANLVQSLRMSVQVDDSLGKATTSSRCSPGYRGWQALVDSLPAVPNWDPFATTDQVNMHGLQAQMKMDHKLHTSTVTCTASVKQFEESIGTLAKKHAALSSIISHDPIKSKDERRLVNLAKEVSLIVRLIAVDGWAGWGHDVRMQLRGASKFLHAATSRCARLTEAMVELIQSHKQMCAGLRAVRARLNKNKETQQSMEANPEANNSGFRKYIPSKDLETVTHEIMRDSRAVSTGTAIAGREMKAIWFLELSRYQKTVANICRRSFALYGALRLQLAKDANIRWTQLLKNLKCDDSAEFALTGTISEPSAALVLPLTVDGLPQRHRSNTDVPLEGDGDDDSAMDAACKEVDDDAEAGGVNGAIKSMSEDADADGAIGDEI
eukprot:g2657.t1